ncbi:MerR family transcriptional regulator [Amycolatopsis coloradensis]|uniref:MerR family transcriptional regulator n=1 Tax=Amycolatopsis coloradensis TaxID=76021 RepID=UPI001FC987E8|nr:MerR family transcriptional regulator [Amycolatopsis coloradensis]
MKRDANGRRVYTEQDVEWLLNCTRFRASGMPLVTIREFAGLVRRGQETRKGDWICRGSIREQRPRADRRADRLPDRPEGRGLRGACRARDGGRSPALNCPQWTDAATRSVQRFAWPPDGAAPRLSPS